MATRFIEESGCCYSCRKQAVFSSWQIRPARSAALLAPGNGIYIQKLVLEARPPEAVQEIFDIHKGSPHREKSVFAHLARNRALCRFSDKAKTEPEATKLMSGALVGACEMRDEFSKKDI